MRLLIKDKGSSKTTGLIYASEATGYPIVTSSKIQVSYIKEQAKSMGCDIPEPLTVNDVRSSGRLPHNPNILFDNIETILEDAVNYYLEANVICATITSKTKTNDDTSDYTENESTEVK